jgi:hypothetical protein
MNGRTIRTLLGIGFLLLSVALAARSAAPAAAAPLPKIATPSSAHIALELEMSFSDAASGESQKITARGEGDFDTKREAMQLSYEMQLPPDFPGADPQAESMAVAMVVVGDRLYMRDPTTQQWMWSDLPEGGYAALQLAPDFSAWNTELAGSDTEFNPVGPEDVNGAATTHWRLELDFAKLFGDPDLAPEGGDATIPPMIMTYDLWIGDADRYVHRMAMGMDFSIPEEEEGGGSFSMAMVMTYSKFDQPVEIVAPAGATPMGESATPELSTGLFPSFSGLPFGGAALGMPNGGISTNAPVASPTPRQNRGGIVVATAEPTATPRPSPTPTRATTATPTALPPTPTTPQPTATAAIVAAAALPPTAVAQSQPVAVPAGEQPRVAPTTQSSSLPLILGAVALAALLALSGGLIVAGRRMGQR